MEAYAARGKLVKTLLLGNLLGALLTWFYFTFIDYPPTVGPAQTLGLDVLYFIVGFSLISGVGVTLMARNGRSLGFPLAYKVKQTVLSGGSDVVLSILKTPGYLSVT